MVWSWILANHIKKNEREGQRKGVRRKKRRKERRMEDRKGKLGEEKASNKNSFLFHFARERAASQSCLDFSQCHDKDGKVEKKCFDVMPTRSQMRCQFLWKLLKL